MKQRWKQLHMLVMAVVVALGCFVMNVAAADTEPTVIKVGYMLNYGTIKSPIIKGSEGYGYEYLTEIFKYAKEDYQLEFVYCEWEEGKAMLQNGELDILGPTTYTEAGAEVYGYPDRSFGDNMIFLSTFSGQSVTYADYNNINGQKIAVQKNNPNEYLLLAFLEENGLNAEIVYFTDNNYESALENLGCDLCLASSLQTFTDLVPVATLGVLDFYYVTNYGNEALIEEMNYAMEQLEKSEFMFQEQLYLTYYNYTISNVHYISAEDFALLQSQALYTVGVENLYSPVAYKNEQGELAGVALDVVEMMAEIAGINYEIIEVDGNTSEQVLQSMDFAFLSITGVNNEDLVDSSPYCTLPFMLIDRAMNGGTIDNIGILSYYGITEVEVENHIYGREIFEYDNIVQMQEAYNQGEIDSFIVTSSTLNIIRDDFEDLSFHSNSLGADLNLTAIFPTSLTDEKIEIFNKVIAQLDETAVSDSVMRHSDTTTSTPPTMGDLMKEHTTGILTAVVLTALAVIGSIWYQRRKLSLIVNRDGLTGFYTQRKFTTEAKRLIAKSPNDTYVIVSLDIDNFKYINEFFGYENGSKVLCAVGESIKGFCGKGIIVARSSADNFLILGKRDEIDEKFHSAQEQSDALFAVLKKLMGDMYSITFSVGVYEINNKNLDLNFMIDCANMARYLGKGTADTTIHKFTAEMDSLRISNNDIVANMAKSLEDQEFLLLYQPKINLTTGKLVGAEALVRWMRNGKMVPPDKFIPLFERNGFIERLDYYVLNKACEFVAAHPETPKISVNLSGVTIMQSGFDRRILSIIDQYGIAYSKIDLEITETAFVEQFEQSLGRIQNLRSKGITISMDDFGAGISSLNRLKNMPIDILKIDRAFIVDSIGNPRGSHIIKCVVQMAQKLNMETVAEGIETKAQEEFLHNLGCDVGQGYYFDRPLPEQDFINLLNK